MSKRTNGTYRVIRPDQIAPLPDPGFPWGFNRTEEDFRVFLEHCQTWFANYPNNPPEKSYVDGANLSYVFEDSDRDITVYQDGNGQYVVHSNGRHRMYVARKYGLSLLVCEVER